MSKHSDTVVEAGNKAKLDESIEGDAVPVLPDAEIEIDETVAAAPIVDDNQQTPDLQAELVTALAKNEDYWDQLTRARAELENVRRRSGKDLANAHKYALEKLMQALLPVLDSMELGLVAVNAEEVSVGKFREGSELTLKMLQGVLEKFDCIPLNPNGEKFDPALHQAISTQEKNDVDPNTILTVVQKGYQLHDRLVRPAMVVVSKAVEAPTAANFDEMA